MKGKLNKPIVRRYAAAYLFALPWIIGTIVFFIIPLIQTANIAMHKYSPKQPLGYELTPLSEGVFTNFKKVLEEDVTFLPSLTASMWKLLYSIPVILLFSIFVGLMLRTEFRGRTFMRGMFFLPVIVSTGVITSILRENLYQLPRGGSAENANIFSASALINYLRESGFPEGVVSFFGSAVSNIMDVVWLSGIQILIILAGLLSIPSSYYEVAKVEGATGWESFWKITLPMVSPYILVIMVYSIIDMSMTYDNSLMRYVMDVTYITMRIDYGTAMFWIAFIVVFVLILLVIGVFSFISYMAKGRRKQHV